MTRLTQDQRRVVTALDTNFCVTSGAGCGKTLVLVERYIHFLEQDRNLPLARLAAITFTENAAAQMRSRIRKACLQQVAAAREANDSVRLQTWLRRYWDVDVAPVNTIHGFCAALLRRWPIEAGVDPQFTVLDETEAAFLRMDVVAATVEELLAAEDADLLTVLEHFNLDEARDILQTVIGEKREVLRRVAGPVMAKGDEEILAGLSKAIAEHVMAAVQPLVDSAAIRDALATLKRLAGQPTDKLEAIRQEAVTQVEQLRRARTADLAAQAANRIAKRIKVNCGSAKLWPSPESLKEAKSALKTLREPFREIVKDLPTFDEPTERRHLTLARAFYRTACRTIDAYQAAKRERSALDFEDLQIRTRDLLRSDRRVRRRCRAQFRAILVDELQDTNLLQFEIVDLLTSGARGRRKEAPLRPGALFGVGDPKQSIYRFRGAEVEVFQRATGRVPATGRRSLSESFRLHPGTAGLVNHLFGPLMGEAYEAIEGRRTQVNDDVAELIHIINPDEPKGFRADEGHAQEARALAARLERIVKTGSVKVCDAGRKSGRPVRYGDIAILLRRTTHLHVYEEAMERRGVPYYVVAGRGFYKQQEVLDVIHLLRVLEDPADDLHLAGVLRSPLFAVSDEGLYRLSRLGRSLHGSLPLAAEAEGFHPEDRRGLCRAARLLPAWTAEKDRLGLAALVDRAAFASGYAAATVGRFGGARAYANLRQMVELARQFERHGLSAPGDYVDYVTDFMQSEMRAEQAAVEAAEGDTVRLMTIHKAKGLEFPVVALPDLGYGPRGPQATWFTHPATGVAVRMREEEDEGGGADEGPHRPPEKTAKKPTSGALALARRAETEAEQDESHRLLYVAMTRAQDYLIFAGHQQYREPRHSWLNAVLDGLGATREPGDRTVRLPAGGTVRTSVRPPLSWRPGRGARRGGPRDIFAAGRVCWDRLRDRAQSAPRRPVEQALRQATAAPQAPRPPARIAATALADYVRCPRLYWWTHVLGVRRPEPAPPALDGGLAAGESGLSPQQWGTVSHRAMELAHDSSDATVRAAADQALREVALAESARGKLSDQLVAAVSAFWQSAVGRRVAAARQVLREIPFVLAFEGTEIRGTIDLALEGSDGAWEIVDYKSSAPSPDSAEEDAARFDLQLGLYALAVGRWLGRDVVRRSVYFLGSAVAVEREISAADLERAAANAREALTAIAAATYDSRDPHVCRHCRYLVLCDNGSAGEPPHSEMGGR